MTVIQIISLLIVTAGSFWLVYRLPVFRKTGLNAQWRLGLWTAKLMAALALFALYTWYYPQDTADMHKYFNDGEVIATQSESIATYARIITGIGMDDPKVQACLEQTSHWNRQYLNGVWNDNRTLIRFNALLYPLTGGSMLAHTFIMAFLAFLGLTLLYRGITMLTRSSKWLALAVFMVPSVWLWSSGLLKEGLLMLNTGLLFFAVVKLSRRFSTKSLLLVLLAVLFFFLTKIYVLLCMVPGLIWLLSTGKPGKKPALKRSIVWFLLLHAGMIIMVWLTSLASPRTDMFRIIEQKQNDFVSMVDSVGDVGSAVSLPDIEASLSSLLKHVPQGFSNSLLRPHLLEINSPMMLLAALEKLAFLLLILLVIFRHRKLRHSEQNLLFFTLSFVIILFSLTGISTPVLGALVRYNIPALPFLAAVLILCLPEKSKK